MGAEGPFVSITAGWREREGETDELVAHVGAPVTDLGLYGLAERLFAEDAPLHAALRARQGRLKAAQEHYRIRLQALLGAALELEVIPGEDADLRRARRAALGDVRDLDREHERVVER